LDEEDVETMGDGEGMTNQQYGKVRQNARLAQQDQSMVRHLTACLFVDPELLATPRCLWLWLWFGLWFCWVPASACGLIV